MQLAAVEDKTMINDYEWDACFTVITQMGRLLWTVQQVQEWFYEEGI